MAISNGDVLKAFLEIVLADGTIVQNVYHWIADFSTTQGAIVVGDAAQLYIEDIMGALTTYLLDDFTINPSYLHKVAWDPVGSKWAIEELIGVFTPDFAHTANTDVFPNQVAPVIVANTARPKSRGRKFFSAFAENSALGSELIGAAITALGVSLNHYLADETVAGDNVLVPGVPRESADVFLPFTDGLVNSILGTQRRRKPGVGA